MMDFDNKNNFKIVIESAKIKKSEDTQIEPFSNWKLLNSELIIGKNVWLGSFQTINLDNAILKIGDNVKIGHHTTIEAIGTSDKKIIVNIGNDVRIDSYSHLECHGNLSLGSKCHLWEGAYIAPFDQPYKIGHRVTFSQKSVMAGRGPLIIKNYSMIGSLTTILTENHNYKDLDTLVREQGFKIDGILIGEDVWIGACVVVLDGSIIADKSVIGAGSVVKGRTERGGVYYGVPIRKSTRLERGTNGKK